MTVLAEAVEMTAKLMALAARTAPKAKGEDFVEIKILTGKEKDILAAGMDDYGQRSGKSNFDRDGENVRNSQAVVLCSLLAAKPLGLNCGACGFSRCRDLEANPKEGPEFKGPTCSWRLLDLGIALGSAVKTASLLNVDNRIMYRIGTVARELKLIAGEIVVGIPLSATGKNIFFDR